MTRGGRKTPLEEQQQQQDEGAAAASDAGAIGSNPEEQMEELKGLVKSLIKAQATRDQKLDKDFSRQEQRWKSMQHQFQQLQCQVNDLTEQKLEQGMEQDEMEDDDDEDDAQPRIGPVALVGVPQREPRLPQLTPEDDIEHFLATFERMAQVCRWPKEDWAIRLVPLLTGKARTAYVLMDITDSVDYEKVKDSILAKYEITADTYRRRFRSLVIEEGETPRELYVRLKDLFLRWIKPEKLSVKEISEQIILEQFLRMVHPELEVWIREHDPKTAEEAARLAEVFTSARRGTQHHPFGRGTRYAQPSKSTGGDQGVGQWQGKKTFSARQSGPQSTSHTRTVPFKPINKEVRCYNCNGLGHTQYFCPALKSKPSLCLVPRPENKMAVEKNSCMVPVLVNGQRCEALLDSGSFQSLVSAKLISEEKLSQHTTTISCIHGDEHDYPTAEVYLTVGGQTYVLSVGVVPSLPYPVILGKDLPTLCDLIHHSDSNLIAGTSNNEGASVTLIEPFGVEIKTGQEPEPSNSCFVVTRSQSVKEALREMPFFDEELEAQFKPRKTRSEKRREKFKGQWMQVQSELPKPIEGMEFNIPTDIGTLQKEDPTLKAWWDKVTETDGLPQGQVSCLDEVQYVVKGGMLYQ
uniref:SCAN box domain-containing protein n=1 Tax=Oryzias sinensis TaxID=183150 RepID=A0A8C8DU52_9TELE